MGTLVSTTAITGRPQILFEYSSEAKSKGLELSAYTLPLEGVPLRRGFPNHQFGLPGPVYDSLPDGWGMMLMDRHSEFLFGEQVFPVASPELLRRVGTAQSPAELLHSPC